MIKRVGKRIKLIIQWTKNAWHETKSWARWHWHYSLPMALAWPLLSRWVKGAVIIIISLLILNLPLQLQITKVIKGPIGGFAEAIKDFIEALWTTALSQASWASFIDF